MKNVSFSGKESNVEKGKLTNGYFLVEFATIQLVNNEVKYDQYKPEAIDALLKEQNVGAASTSETATA